MALASSYRVVILHGIYDGKIQCCGQRIFDVGLSMAGCRPGSMSACALMRCAPINSFNRVSKT